MELSTFLLHAAKDVIILLSPNEKFNGISRSEDEYLSLDVYATLALGVAQSNAQSHLSPFKWSD